MSATPNHPFQRSRTRGAVLALVLGCAVAWLTGCGDRAGSPAPGATPSVATPSPSAGQVAPPAAAAQVSYYAASRFAEQASFGPTPALVAEIRSKGFERWIDEQLAMAPTLLDMTPFLGFTDNSNNSPAFQAEMKAYQQAFMDAAIGAPDQLRLRTTWSISQFVVVSHQRIDVPGAIVHWINMLQQRGLGTYDDLLYRSSVHSTMGHYLDNVQNRPKSSECGHCAPNENYARELMQLFTLGVYKLNLDGTPQRDNRGRLVETYSQRDVEELARVLTGWRVNPEPAQRPGRNWGNWTQPMVPSTWAPERDSGAKNVLGQRFRAGQTAPQDLQQAVDLLMSHPNIAPFVATRMIQHLVKSNPSPDYVRRIAQVFLDNGSGVRGDMKAIVKAILLDTEARAGDSPAAARPDDGKIREPLLHRVGLYRGLGCTRAVTNIDGWAVRPQIQRPLEADSVFSYYAPTDRAPGSNLLAPEQTLLITNEWRERLGAAENGRQWNPTTRLHDYTTHLAAGCELEALSTKLRASPSEYVDHLSQRWFRGAMPPTLRSNLEQIARQQWPPWNKDDPHEGSLRLLGYALATPYYGAIK